MKRIEIDKDEAYPVYCFSITNKPERVNGNIRTVSASQLARWNKIQAKYDEMQAELKALDELQIIP